MKKGKKKEKNKNKIKRMLTAQTDKHLYGKFERKRNEALKDPSRVPVTGRFGLTDLGVTPGAGGIDNKDAFVMDNWPADREIGFKKIDIRTLPGRD